MALVLYLAACGAPVGTAPVVRYGWSDLATLRWEHATSRALAVEKYLGILGTSQTQLHVSVIQHTQHRGPAVIHDHDAAFVFSREGVHVLTMRDGRTRRVPPLDGASEGDVGPYTHTVEGDTNIWYSIALRTPAATADEVGAVVGSTVLYATPTLPVRAHQMHGGVLRLVELQGGGATAIRTPAEALAVYVLAGRPSLHTSASASQRLGPGDGAYFVSDQPSQWTLETGTTAQVLEFYIGPTGDSTETGRYMYERSGWP